MTREEAIKYLIKPVATSTEIGEEKQKEFEAYNMAISALSADDDLISRADAIDALIAEANTDGAYGYIDARSSENVISALPSAEAVHGEWVNSKTAKGYVVCSNCNKLTTNINRTKYNYCPFCGARMKGCDSE